MKSDLCHHDLIGASSLKRFLTEKWGWDNQHSYMNSCEKSVIIGMIGEIAYGELTQ